MNHRVVATFIVGHIPLVAKLCGYDGIMQVAALAKRAIANNRAPYSYSDFAIWLPFGRRALKVQRLRTYTPLGDGSHIILRYIRPRFFSSVGVCGECSCVPP